MQSYLFPLISKNTQSYQLGMRYLNYTGYQIFNF